jgi:hypothetical protein
MAPISFYVMAHEDDWQMFRGEQAWIDIQTGGRVVFVYTTAGDAGRTDGWWEAREQGAIACCRLASPGQLKYAVQQFNGHAITVVTCGATASYFLRLPDGNLDNGGYGTPAYGYQSLLQLQLSNKAMTAVDGSAQYTNWHDLCATVQKILSWETANSGNASPWVNCSDYDTTYNPGDHPDHYATGAVVLSFAVEYPVAWWVGYDIANRNPNLPPDQVGMKYRLVFRYNDTMLAETTMNGYPTDEYAQAAGVGYDDKMQKSYFRT